MTISKLKILTPDAFGETVNLRVKLNTLPGSNFCPL